MLVRRRAALEPAMRKSKPNACPIGPTAALLAVLSALPAAPAEAQPNPLDAIVGVQATIPADARTARILGTEREGSGVVIDEAGLILTIGYLIMESSETAIELPGGGKIPAEVVAYDYDSGFGLLRPLSPIDVVPIRFGDSAALAERSQVLVASSGASATPAYVVSRRDFAGYWEYLLPDAIFTAPPHAGFGGAALIGADGRLLGIGSLIVGDAAEIDRPIPGNMFVPIDALKPILKDLIAHGRAATPPRPWLGLYTEEVRGRLFVNRVAPDGPAAAAGLAINDVIVAVEGTAVRSQADFYRKIWALGESGVAVPLTVMTEEGLTEITVTSGDRYDYLKLDPTY